MGKIGKPHNGSKIHRSQMLDETTTEKPIRPEALQRAAAILAGNQITAWQQAQALPFRAIPEPASAVIPLDDPSPEEALKIKGAKP
jgi:hypothetical protein